MLYGALVVTLWTCYGALQVVVLLFIIIIIIIIKRELHREKDPDRDLH